MVKFNNEELSGVGLDDDATTDELINYYSPIKNVESIDVNVDIDMKSGDFSSKRSDWLEVGNPNHDENINKYTITIPSMPLISPGTTIKSFNTALSLTLQTPSRAEIIKMDIEAMLPEKRAKLLHELEHKENRNPHEEIQYKVLQRIDINEKAAESDYMQRSHDQKIEVPLIDYSKAKLWSMTSEVDSSKIHVWPNPSLHSFNLENYSKKESPLHQDYSVAVWIGDKIVVNGIYIGKDGKQYTLDGKRHFTTAEKNQVIIENEINNSGGIYLTENMKKLKDNEMVTAGKHPSAVGEVNKYFDNTLGKDIASQILTNPEFRNADGNLKSRSEINKMIDDKFYHGEFGARGLPTLQGMRDAVQKVKQIPLITTPNFSRDNPVEAIKWTSDNPKPPNTNTRTNMVFMEVGITAGLDYSLAIGKDDYGTYYVTSSKGYGLSLNPIKKITKVDTVGNISVATTMKKHNSAEEASTSIAGQTRYGGFSIGLGVRADTGRFNLNPSNIESNIVSNSLNTNLSLNAGIADTVVTGTGEAGLMRAIYLVKLNSLGIINLSPEAVEKGLREGERFKEDYFEVREK